MLKKKRKIKRKIIRFLVFLLILVAIYIVYFSIIGDNIKNVIISGNNRLSEKEILEITELNTYPSFIKTTKYSLIKKLKENVFVKNATIKKTMNFQIIIDIEEYKLLFKDTTTNKYVLDNGKSYELDEEYNVPILLNYIPDNIFSDFVMAMGKLENSIIDRISEIKYAPNDYDDDLFLFYMNDQNLVQITSSKIDKMNKYNEVIVQLNGEKGILYLDSGNYFKIMK